LQKNQTINSTESSDTKEESKQDTKARLGESLKRKWGSNVMHGQCIRNVDRQLLGGGRHKRRSERRLKLK